ncbi:macrolide 2'-phosphotransferase [Paenibacillus polymyxa]|uniref:macrolide 2'-phosphotransferase n=1 Tax=Paenibacillus polymyxa TaxID=1406 RepID=UPI0025B65B32|nr:macrolide 2'-phosphotransferase [Paenibacillus polymyxa]MDN4084607.1 macrolide 2'-phosphotransferase [Paenibacillus polymyxa]MDN4090315.1 macrolide 2'-phosphotransferase [Paenibacillus polymyxa]MDN4111087.1 macrolide 2'-phosphotransferase [Paenibacillus polymyxa]
MNEKRPLANPNDVSDILALAQNNGLHIQHEGLELNESGLDFRAVFAKDIHDTPWVLRTPRRADVIQSAAYEHKVLRMIRDTLPIAVPDWQIYSPKLIAYPQLGGTPAATIDMETKSYVWFINPDALTDRFVASLAKALAALHRIDYQRAADFGVRVKQHDEVRQLMAQRMEDTRRVFGVSEELWQRWQAWLADDSYWPAYSAFVHGDLHPGHILVSSNTEVTGILDWTEAEVADPAIDFTSYYTLFGEVELARLLKLYETAGGRVWPRMSDHIVELTSAYPVLIAEFALKSGLEEYMDMARNALGVHEQGEGLPDI